MLNLHERVELLSNLQQYILENGSEWTSVKERASNYNAWFTPAFIDIATNNIVSSFLNKEKLLRWAADYAISPQNERPVNVGITMAGNIPLVGFHDFLCAFIQGH